MARREPLDQSRTLVDLGPAIDWLRDLQPFAAGPIGTIGFCMGGTLVLDLAAEGRPGDRLLLRLPGRAAPVLEPAAAARPWPTT